MSEPTEPPDEPNPEEPRTDEPKDTAKPAALDLSDEEWIAASQSCCGRPE